MQVTPHASLANDQRSALLPASPAVTRMQQLRHATRDAHARIELALPLLQPSLTVARYVQVLTSFYGFYAPLERQCERATGTFGAALDLATRAKTPLLAADLCALGQAPALLHALPRCRALPQVASLSQAIGALYVMEGATLGGQIIGRQLSHQLHLGARDGAAFFSGYGEQTREMWRRFSGHVERAEGLDIEQAMSAAVATFETLERWLVATAASA